MVEARQTRSAFLRAWTLATVAVAGLASAGCTMCPDPFDYSGPVPNGSAPQNDFRARSGGILPLGAAPHPWPLIVKGEGQPEEAEPSPAPADEVVGGVVDEGVNEVVDEGGGRASDENLRQTVAVVGESEPEQEPEQEPKQEPKQEPVVPVEAAPPASATAPPARFEPLPAISAGPPRPAGETPGWHARRR